MLRGLPRRQLTRQELGDCVRAAFDNPLSESGSAGRPATSGAAVKKLVVFQEEHENGEPHFHVAVLLKAERMWLPAKRTLRVRDRLASHWSSTHRHFW